jgi:ubiquinone/menaquinone biosynthesis C-methylase UbiE
MTGAPDAWDDERTARWVRQAEGIERQLQPVSEVLFAAAQLRSGERVLDIGCGTGPTTRQASALVGPTGGVTGVDITSEMLSAAATIPADPQGAPIEWLLADPVSWTPPTPHHDVVLSRFGVMFFSDPEAAFKNLADGVGPDGRLAVATWARRGESEMFQVPFGAALGALGQPDELPQDEGPFSLSDPAVIGRLLGDAGWRDVVPVVHQLRLPYAGGVDSATAAEASLDFGPTRIVTKDLDDADRARVVAAITEALRPYEVDGTVLLHGTVLVTTARRG